ncbi:MAG: spore cortex biosynthesis protein YabQ [Ruminococcus sp.]|nr:spore cortex biosynthesis protein YabQ [Ruminococcus sp.]
MIPMQLGTGVEPEVLRDAAAAGVLAGVVYDLFRLIRRLFPCKAVEVICDLLFALAFSLMYFTVSIALTDNLRGLVLFGMAAGAVMWCSTAGRGIVWLAALIIKGIAGKIARFCFVLLNKFSKHLYSKTVRNAINLQKRKKISQST